MRSAHAQCGASQTQIPVLPNSLGLQLPFSRVLNLQRCPPNDRNTSTPRRHGLGRTHQTSEVSASGGGNWLGELRNTVTRAMHSEDPSLPEFSETEKHAQLPWRATESSQTRRCQSVQIFDPPLTGIETHISSPHHCVRVETSCSDGELVHASRLLSSSVANLVFPSCTWI